MFCRRALLHADVNRIRLCFDACHAEKRADANWHRRLAEGERRRKCGHVWIGMPEGDSCCCCDVAAR